MSDENKERRPAYGWAAFRVLLVGLAFGTWFLFGYSKSPFTDAWNPLVPLNIADEYTPLTKWKMRRALAGTESCLAALETGARVERLPDFEESDQCHIRPQVRISGVGDARLSPVKTRCQTALRIAMWERHGIQPAAQRLLSANVARIEHFSSYSCRQMRTTNSGAPRMSAHATADAIDVSGFVLSDGRKVTLLANWKEPEPQAAFLKDVRDSACAWFRVTLGPDYNRLHADHFHLQHTGWGLCR